MKDTEESGMLEEFIPNSLLAKFSIILIIITSLIRKRISKSLRSELTEQNPSKMYINHYLSSCSLPCVLCLLVPFLLYDIFTFQPQGSLDLKNLVNATWIAILLFIADFFGETYARSFISTSLLTKFCTIGNFVAAILYEWYNDFNFSFITLFIFLCIFFGQHFLLKDIKKLDYSSDNYNEDELLPLSLSSKSENSFLKNAIVISHFILKSIWEGSNSRRIFIFLLINFIFMFVELLYGCWSNSLGLISDAFHMLSDCLALVIGLVASVISKWEKDRAFSYGFARLEVLAGFVNAIFLCYTSFSIFSSSLKRIISPPQIIVDRLILVSILGLVVNLIGILFFHDFDILRFLGVNEKCKHKHDDEHRTDNHSHSIHFHSDHQCEHSNYSESLHGIFLHILADTMGSVGVVISSILVYFFEWNISDPICSLGISILIFISVMPLIKSSLRILMQACPSTFYHQVITSLLKSTKTISGVLSYSEPHFWEINAGKIIGSLKLQVSPLVSTQLVLNQSKELFKSSGISMTFQVEEINNFTM